MSIKWMTHAWKLDDLNIGEKLILLAIADNANNDGICWPSITDIAERCCVTERHAIRVVCELQNKGHLKREMRSGKSTIYHMLTPDICDTPRTPSTPVLNVTPDNMSPLTFEALTPDICDTPTPDICDISPTPPYKEEPPFEPSKRTVNTAARKKKSKKIQNYSPHFSQFWNVYPRHEKKSDAATIFEELITQGINHEIIIDGAGRYAEHVVGNGTPEDKIAHPTTWLNASRWEDEYRKSLPKQQPSKTTDSLAALYHAGNRNGTSRGVEPEPIRGRDSAIGFDETSPGGRTYPR